ncbi:hypothetical protein HDE_06212 [Halotydeus destructor]|nr:hypothetical protein HDE_06212 [Halotydeus destructor]
MAMSSCFNVELFDSEANTLIDHFKQQREYGPVVKLVSEKFSALQFTSTASFDDHTATIAKLQSHPLSPSYVMMPMQTAREKSSGNLAIVYDFGAFRRLKIETVKRADWLTKLKIMTGIARCLSHFHETLGIRHGSLVPKMVFWDSRDVKLGVPLDEMEEHDFCSPEYLLARVAVRDANSIKSDIWSLGSLFYFVLSEGRLFSTGGYNGEIDDFSPMGYNEPDLSQTRTWKTLHRYLRMFSEDDLHACDTMTNRRKQVVAKRLDFVYNLHRHTLSEEALTCFDTLAVYLFTELLNPDPDSRPSIVDLQRKLTTLM